MKSTAAEPAAKDMTSESDVVVVALTDATIADQPRGAALRSACVAALPRPSCVEPTLTNGLERASGVRVELSRTMLAAAAPLRLRVRWGRERKCGYRTALRRSGGLDTRL